ALQRSHARKVHVARFSVDDVAHRTCADLAGVELRALHRFPYDPGRQLGRRHVLQRAAVVADRRARARKHHHFASVHIAAPSRAEIRNIAETAPRTGRAGGSSLPRTRGERRKARGEKAVSLTAFLFPSRLSPIGGTSPAD